MERQEPVIDSARTLQNRVKLTWREVRDLAVDQKEPMLGTAPSGARPDSVTEAAVPAADPQPVPKASPVATLSDADRAAIAAYLSPRIEEAPRSALRDALDMAIANAATRVKSDVERALGGIVTQTVLQELEKVDFSKLLKH